MIWLFIAILLGIVPSAGMAQSRQPTHVAAPQSVSQTDTRVAAATPAPSAAQPDMPVYKPPQRGAPSGRVAGGTRGSSSSLPLLAALAPNHTGLTIHEQPVLYWHLAEASPYPMAFTLIDMRTVKPVAQQRLAPREGPGMQRIPLAEYNVNLQPGVTYHWFVTLIVDDARRDKDIAAGGSIERIPPPETLTSRLAQAGPARAPHIYAEAGLWYDAIMAVSQLIDAAPQDHALRRQRAALLGQVGLSGVAMADLP